MICQGEKVLFSGTFKQKIGETIVEIQDLTTYKVVAKIQNPVNNVIVIYGTSDNSITIAADKKTYSFVLTPKQTASMLGECFCEMGLLDSNDNPILTKTKATFTIHASSLGRDLAQI